MKARRTCGGVNPLRPVAGFFKPRCRSRRTASIISFWSSRKSEIDRKSTRLNSSHGYISYAVFCLKKKQHERLRVVQVLQQVLQEPKADVGFEKLLDHRCDQPLLLHQQPGRLERRAALQRPCASAP